MPALQEEPTPQRILIVRTSHLGDVVHGLPLLGALHRAWPEARIAWVVQNEFAPLLEGAKGLERVIRFDRRGGVRGWLRARTALREFAPDWSVDCQGNAKSASLALASGARLRLGYSPKDWREPWCARSLTHAAPPAFGPHALHRIAALADLVAPGAELSVDLGLRGDERRAGRAALQVHRPRSGSPLFLLHLGVGGDPRSWPLESWRELALRLSDAGCAVLLLSGPGEEALGRDLERDLAHRPGIGHWVGQRDLRLLAAALAEAEGALFVGTDSGPTHLAAAAGRAVVMLSGPQDPARTGPWPLPSTAGSPHRVLRAVPGGLGPMHQLSPERVARALLSDAR